MEHKDKKYFLNDKIRASKILLLDEEWKRLWIFWLDEALAMWAENWLDIVQIWYNPELWQATAKMTDYGKFMYSSKKDENAKKKTQKVKWLKEVKFWYNIWDNDLQIKLEKAKEFLQEWHSVKFIWTMRWREFYYKDKVLERLENIWKGLEDLGRTQWIKPEKWWFSMILLAKLK